MTLTEKEKEILRNRDSMYFDKEDMKKDFTDLDIISENDQNE
tara:strand:- start:8792 stop:8917 length:126 start_codon:yes stop_codon:yes gene_type:complete